MDMDRQLLAAAKKGDVAEVHRLLAVGADIRAEDSKGRTPLHYASAYGHVGVIKALIVAGADPCAMSNRGWTPLHWASERDHVGAIKALVAAGADLHATNNGGKTALHMAACGGHVDAIAALVAAGADLHTKDIEGGTALRYASENCPDGIVEALEDAGVDSIPQDNWGRIQLLAGLEAKVSRRRAAAARGAMAGEEPPSHVVVPGADDGGGPSGITSATGDSTAREDSVAAGPAAAKRGRYPSAADARGEVEEWLSRVLPDLQEEDVARYCARLIEEGFDSRKRMRFVAEGDVGFMRTGHRRALAASLASSSAGGT